MTTNETEVKRRRRGPRGQAMVEYSVVSHFILMGGGLAMIPVMSKLIEGLNTYYDSVFAVIQTAAF